MIMDDGEIIREYKEARTKMKQVGILAELNCVSKQEMAQWLVDHGQEVAKNFWPKANKKNDEVEPEEVAEEEPIEEAPEKDLYMRIIEDSVSVGSNMHVGSNIHKPVCTLTADQAYSVAELIDKCLFDEIRNDTDFDSLQALKNIIYAYDLMCKCSGYVGMTE